MAVITTFTLTSPATIAAAPYTIGHSFKEGEVPAGVGVVGTGLTFQCHPKNYWGDGSLKYALLSGTASLTANTPTTITLSTGTPAGGTVLTIANLKGSGITANFGTDIYGGATFGNTEWGAPFEQLASGPVMSSWRFRKPIGADAHLVAWLEVRCYASGAVQVLPWIENGYLKVANPSNRIGAYTLHIGGVQVFSDALDIRAHTRTVLIKGTHLCYWHGIADPLVIPKHNGDYLSATKLVPTYYRATPVDAPVVAGLPATFTPFQQGSFRSQMGDGGFSQTLGIIPGVDALYITCAAPEAYTALLRNGFSVGRFGIHLRDETTNRPIRYSQYPNLVLSKPTGGMTAIAQSSTNDYTPAESGGSTFMWSNSHHPSVGFLAYLVSGWNYFIEQLQFAVTATYLKNQDTHRQFSSGIMLGSVGANEVRGASWAIRSMAQCAALSPDGQAVTDEIRAQVAANIEFNHARYVAQTNNQFGFIKDYTDYDGVDGKLTLATWQHHFYTMAFGHLKSLDPPMSPSVKTKLAEFFAWKAKHVIGMLGGLGADEFHYSRAGQYKVVIALQDNAATDFNTGTGPWLPNWGAVFQETLGIPNPGVPLDLVSSNGFSAGSYWANLTPAIAFAVEHGVAGASEAYNRLVTAPSWAVQEESFADMPVWGIKPATLASVPTPDPEPIPDPEPEPAVLPFTPDDIKLFMAGPEGLGGTISDTDLGGRLFGDIIGITALGRVDYACMYVKNDHPTRTLNSVVIWLQENTPNPGTMIEIGLGASPINGIAQVIDSASAAPAGVLFFPAGVKGSGLLIGNLPPGAWKAVWLRRTVSAGEAPVLDLFETFTPYVEGIPQ